MESAFKTWKTSRNIYRSFFDRYSLEQLNKIPEGFNNNLIWNIGHVIVVQQLLIYRGSGLPMNISKELVGLYKPGTSPLGAVTHAQADELRGLLISLVDKTEADFRNNLFTDYTGLTTTTGFHLASLEDALVFNNYHEGLHLGYMMSIRRFV
jgi:hypothetical protein